MKVKLLEHFAGDRVDFPVGTVIESGKTIFSDSDMKRMLARGLAVEVKPAKSEKAE